MFEVHNFVEDLIRYTCNRSLRTWIFNRIQCFNGFYCKLEIMLLNPNDERLYFKVSDFNIDPKLPNEFYKYYSDVPYNDFYEGFIDEEIILNMFRENGGITEIN